MSTIEFGIDLGTTNSVVAVRDGTGARVIKNTKTQADSTPSSVYIGKRGRILVGQPAKNQQIDFPRDVAVEFKRLMGMQVRHSFPQAGRQLTPEELSAEVLKSLASDVSARYGRGIDAAVITVPASFHANRRCATYEAGQLAGIGQVSLLQEPLAAAVGYGLVADGEDGLWLVFDLGGGTFDVAIVQFAAGEMRVLDNHGDDHLGGRDCDWLIVDKILVPQLRQSFDLPELSRATPGWENIIWRLKIEAEQARIGLTTLSETVVSIDEGRLGKDGDGRDIFLDCTLTRKQYEHLAEPKFSEALALCRELLERNHLSRSDLSKVVLVGGATMTPLVQQMLKAEFGLEADTSVDPMTVVAVGAAIYGGTLQKDTVAPVSANPPTISGVCVDLEYAPTQEDTEAVVGITISPVGAVSTVEINREDGGWSSGRIPVHQGKLTGSVSLLPMAESVFLMQAQDANGQLVDAATRSFSIAHIRSFGKAPLAHTISIGLADGRSLPVIRKNELLPACGMVSRPLTKTVHAGDPESVAVFHVLEGESDRSGRNWSIGQFEVRGNRVPQTLPIGTVVEVTVKADDSGLLSVQVSCDLLKDPIEGLFDWRKGIPDNAVKISSRIKTSRDRLDKLKSDAAEIGMQTGDLNEIERSDSIGEAESEADLGAQITEDLAMDELAKAARRITKVEERLDRFENKVRWPALEKECRWFIAAVQEIAESTNEDRTTVRISALVDQAEEALRAKDESLVRRLIVDLWRERHRLLFANAEYWKAHLAWFEANAETLTDPVRAGGLLRDAREALDVSEFPKANALVAQLHQMLPDDAEPGDSAFPADLR